MCRVALLDAVGRIDRAVLAARDARKSAGRDDFAQGAEEIDLVDCRASDSQAAWAARADSLERREAMDSNSVSVVSVLQVQPEAAPQPWAWERPARKKWHAAVHCESADFLD